MAIISGRLGFIWILNIANLVYIIWYTRITYNQRYSDERKRRQPKMRRQDTENRIKNWQLFYGEIDDSNKTDPNTTGTHLNSNHRCSFLDEEYLNYTTTFKELEDYNHERRKLESSIPEQELCSTFKSSSSIGNDQKTVVVQAAQEAKKRVQITDLVSHLPWSYIDSNHQLPSARTKDEVYEKDLRPKRVVVLEPGKSVGNPQNEQVSRF